MSKITQYELLTEPAGDDLLPVVDVSDQTMAYSGTDKKVAVGSLPFLAPAGDGSQLTGITAAQAGAVPATGLPTISGDAAQKIVVPLYEYPTYYNPTGDYQTVQAAAPTASIVILNAGSPGGPGTYTEDWTAQITELHAAGVSALGYVSTDYGATSLATVKGQIDTWYGYYPNLDGIFFDEGAYLADVQPYYATLYSYVKGKGTGQRIVLLNPGDIPDQSYMECSDIICTCENTYSYYTNSYAASQPDWLPYYPASRFLHIIEDVTTLAQLGQVLALSRTFRAGYVYAIDSAGAYTALTGDATSNPLIWSHQVAWCRQGYVTGPSPTLTLANGGTITWEYQYGSYWLAASAAVTGLILSAPSLAVVPPALTAPQSAGIRVTLANTSAYSMTFAASGTSNVADGAGDVIPAGTAADYVWNPATALWYRVTASLPLTTGTPAQGEVPTFTGAGYATVAVGLGWQNAVTAFGADPTGQSDSTAAIQAAVNAGLLVFLPAGAYKISSALALRTGSTLAGAGMGATALTQVAGNAHGLSGVDVSQITIRDLELNGTGAGSGSGVNIVPSANPNVAYIDVENVLASGWGNVGVRLDTPIASHLRKVLAFGNGGDGFQLSNAKGTPTSVTFDSCYAKGNGFAGYELDGAAYCSLNGCASDSNPNGYALYSCQAVALAGCGAESFTAVGWVFDGCAGCKLDAGWTYNGKTTVAHVTDGTVDQTITGLVETSPASGATSCILTDSGTSSVIINPKSVTANSYASGTVYVITSAGGAAH